MPEGRAHIVPTISRASYPLRLVEAMTGHRFVMLTVFGGDEPLMLPLTTDNARQLADILRWHADRSKEDRLVAGGDDDA